MIKRWAVLGLSIVVLSAGAAAAQEGHGGTEPGDLGGTRERPGGGTAVGPVIDRLSELTGLTLIEIREGLQGG